MQPPWGRKNRSPIHSASHSRSALTYPSPFLMRREGLATVTGEPPTEPEPSQQLPTPHGAVFHTAAMLRP